MQNTLSRNTAKIERLYILAEENNIPIDETCPDSVISMSVRLGDKKKIIGLSNDERSTYTKLERLAHEMGHCMTDSFYLGYSPFELRAKHEHRANAWAVNEIVPFPDLCEAVRNGYRELWELAEYFGVSSSFMEKAINIHERNGNVVPREFYEEA